MIQSPRRGAKPRSPCFMRPLTDEVPLQIGIDPPKPNLLVHCCGHTRQRSTPSSLASHSAAGPASPLTCTLRSLSHHSGLRRSAWPMTTAEPLPMVMHHRPIEVPTRRQKPIARSMALRLWLPPRGQRGQRRGLGLVRLCAASRDHGYASAAFWIDGYITCLWIDGLHNKSIAPGGCR